MQSDRPRDEHEATTPDADDEMTPEEWAELERATDPSSPAADSTDTGGEQPERRIVLEVPRVMPPPPPSPASADAAVASAAVDDQPTPDGPHRVDEPVERDSDEPADTATSTAFRTLVDEAASDPPSADREDVAESGTSPPPVAISPGRSVVTPDPPVVASTADAAVADGSAGPVPAPARGDDAVPSVGGVPAATDRRASVDGAANSAPEASASVDDATSAPEASASVDGAANSAPEESASVDDATSAPEAVADAPAVAVESGADGEPARSAHEGDAHPAARRMPLPRVIAVANQKGGVGKTTTTVNVAACLAEQGYRTLLVDLDPQANASTGLGLEPRELAHSIYHVMLHGEPADSCIEPTEVKNLFVLPSSLDLAGAEIELVSMMSREHRLRLAIEAVLDDYDYVLIDCPPSLGLLTINALTAAKEVMVPIQCEYYALEGLGQLMRNVELVKANLNPTLQISHIILVMFDPRTNLAGQVVDEVRSHFGSIVCKNVIPRTVRLSEAPSFGQPITTFDSTSRGAVAYRAVTQEVLDGQA